ncbi:MAG: terpene cyclase/mutase family protein [bacterium]|nr:terpene cyclase/mutase family protein [bacterium]
MLPDKQQTGKEENVAEILPQAANRTSSIAEPGQVISSVLQATAIGTKERLEHDPVKAIAEWMAHSEIQSPDGGVYAWYDAEKNEHSYLYSEITGYAITTFLYLYKLYGDEQYLRQAEKAADWLMQKAMSECGGVKTRYFIDDKAVDEHTSFSGGNVFSFDTAMVLDGFTNLYKATHNERYLTEARKMADFLVNTMQKPDGSFMAIYNEKTGEVPNSTKKWSTQSGSFHAKNAIGLTNMYELTGDEQYKDSAIRACDYALTKQDGSGRFVTDDASLCTHLHPHCYAIEGLSYAGSVFGKQEFIEAARKATEWALAHVDQNGINEVYYPATGQFSNFQRSDVIAQVLRMGLLYSNDEKLKQLKDILLRYQSNADNGSEKGGIAYSKTHEHVNFWATAFALQALALYQNKNLIPKPGERFDLLV